MSARVIPENSLITLSTGKELLSWSISLPNLFFLPFRVPENCAHSVVTHPTDPPPRPTKISPRPHSQLNSGTVVVNPSKDIAEAVYHYLKTSDKVPTFAFPDQDLLSAFFEGKWRPIPWYYNALKALRHVHPKEWSDDEVRCVHYIFPEKPWQRRVDSPEVEELYGTLHGWWWQQFDELGNEMKATNPEGWKLVLSTVDTLL
jgi:lipopolysaccharide biosynthesis glycosyltransferase